MKKVLWILLIFSLIISVSACESKETLTQLQEKYATHISNNQEVYQAHIDYYNRISLDAIRSVVLVTKTIYEDSGSAKGTGVVFNSDEHYYYVLTNNHIIYIEEGQQFSYNIVDYNGNEYVATLVADDNNFDLAILKIEKGELDLRVIDLAASNPETGEVLAIIGNPSNRVNAITLGRVISYLVIEINTFSKPVINIDFEILICDASVKAGSSGSAVLNKDLELVGIVYAGNFVRGIETSNYTFVIPIEKVKAFFIEQNYILGGDET